MSGTVRYNPEDTDLRYSSRKSRVRRNKRHKRTQQAKLTGNCNPDFSVDNFIDEYPVSRQREARR
jgi:hypothetical protein